MIKPGPGRNIIWLASYPRSGNTWARIFLHNLIEITSGRDQGGGHINDINTYSTWEAHRTHFEWVMGRNYRPNDYAGIFAARPKVQAELARRLAPGTPLVKTHLGILSANGHGTINISVTAGGIYFVRNPLDVVSSLAAHLALDLDAAIDMMNDPNARLASPQDADRTVFEPMGTWAQHVAGWTGRPSEILLVVRYEDMLERPLVVFGAIARHLRFAPTDEQLARAVDISRFDRLQGQERQDGYSTETKLGNALFFRKGAAGQWRTALTREQVRRVVDGAAPVMERFGYLKDAVNAVAEP